MFRRLLVGVALVAGIAALGPALQSAAPAEASPANAINSLVFAPQVTTEGVPVGERIEFSRDTHIVWAVVNFNGLANGTQLTYILRLNGWDYSWGSMACCDGVTNGRLAFPLHNKDTTDEVIPGGAYTLYIYNGDTEVARGGFGVNGGRGSDNSDPEPTN
ncbi:MAG: hypothetical protein IT305_24760 [Chloroflexi bacterium]|nr:hypothetical protein [Chloroflexota bacterium]